MLTLAYSQELKSIKRAAARFGNYNPKVTFVICAKRHSMRFFASSDADKDRTGNLPPEPSSTLWLLLPSSMTFICKPTRVCRVLLDLLTSMLFHLVDL